MRAALAAESGAESVKRLAETLRAEKNVDLEVLDSAESLRERVRRGAVDVGVILRGDLAALGNGPAPIVVVADATHAMVVPGTAVMAASTAPFCLSAPSAPLVTRTRLSRTAW